MVEENVSCVLAHVTIVLKTLCGVYKKIFIDNDELNKIRSLKFYCK